MVDEDRLMAQLQQHHLAHLVGLEGEPIAPGFYVRHRKSENSFGLVIGYLHEFGWPTQVLVLWSCQPWEQTDIEYLRQKLAAAVKIPSSMLGFK
jgi:hypothetical protein